MCLVHVQSQQSSQSKHGKKFLLRLCLMEPRFVPNSLRSRNWSWTAGPPSKCRDCRRGSPHPVYTTISTVPLLMLLLPLQLLECVNGCPCHGLLLLIIRRISRSPSLPTFVPTQPWTSSSDYNTVSQMERPDLSRVKCPALNQSRETSSPSSSCEGKTGSQIGKHSGRKGSLWMPDVLLQSQT